MLTLKFMIYLKTFVAWTKEGFHLKPRSSGTGNNLVSKPGCFDWLNLFKGISKKNFKVLNFKNYPGLLLQVSARFRNLLKAKDHKLIEIKINRGNFVDNLYLWYSWNLIKSHLILY